jgi:hypothetical protein
MLFKELEEGEVRIVKGFLWFPIKIGGVTRWLEYAEYQKRWVHFVDYDGAGYEWKYEKWLDKPDGV